MVRIVMRGVLVGGWRGFHAWGTWLVAAVTRYAIISGERTIEGSNTDAKESTIEAFLLLFELFRWS